jgi:hypothetical protein
MKYLIKVSFDEGKNWYQLQWENMDFTQFDRIKGLKDVTTIDGLQNLVKKNYPNVNLTWTLLDKVNTIRKKKTRNGK